MKTIAWPVCMRCLVFAFSWFLSAACAAPRAASEVERLYFALELRHEGKLVGKPKLLGETGKVVRAELRRPGAPEADYRLVLSPLAEGADAYQIQLALEVPRASVNGHKALGLLHGEERKLTLGDLEVKLLLMKVDSPEFRALMQLADPTGTQAPTSI